MKAFWLGLVLVSTAAGDMIYLANGKTVTGRVVRYSQMTFEVADEKGAVSRHAQAMVKRIQFTGGEASIATVNRGSVRGVLTGYESAQFLLKTGSGEERISTTMVREVNFGGGVSVKAIAQVTGNDLMKHVPRGKVTIVDFYADWCGPCRVIGPQLEKMARDDADVVLRKVNVDRNASLSEQYKVSSIPHIIVFDRTGKEVGTVTGLDTEGVKQLVAKAKAS